MVYESVIEETIISLLQNRGYELIDENDNWILNRNLDEFFNEDLLGECLIKINKINNNNVIQDAINSVSETRSIVLITNRNLSDWKDMKVDAHLVETLKARLMSGAQLIHLKNNN